MPWKQRKNHRYFYTSERDADGNTRSVYHGSGPGAHALARAAERRSAARAEAQAVRLDADGLDVLVRDALASARRDLEAVGCHRHKGQWRRKRMGDAIIKRRADAAVPAINGAAPEPSSPTPFMKSLVTGHAVDGLIGPGHPKGREIVLGEIDQVARDLAGPDPSPTERLLAEAGAMAWWHLQRASIRSTHSMPDPTFRAVGASDAHYDRALNRFLKVVRTIAVVRRLNVRDLLVNIGPNMVNIHPSRASRERPERNTRNT